MKLSKEEVYTAAMRLTQQACSGIWEPLYILAFGENDGNSMSLTFLKLILYFCHTSNIQHVTVEKLETTDNYRGKGIKPTHILET